MASSAINFSDVMHGYFTGIPEPVKEARPGLFTLTSLLNFHLKKYAFSTLHANANDTPPLDRLSLVSRLVDAKAGYCFHHNVAFFEAMRAMNFENMFFVAGTFPGNDLPTHIAIVWKKQDDDWYLVDPGAGYGISYPIPFDSSRKNPGPYRIRKNNDAYVVEKRSPKTNEYEKIYEFGIQPLSLDSDIFQKAVQILTTPKHIFYNNFWHFGMDRNNRVWNVILTVNDQGTIETELLLIDGKKQVAPSPLAFTASRTNGIFRTILNGNSFINKHLHEAVVDKFKSV
jgi:arylamine N-acetyltransferase